LDFTQLKQFVQGATIQACLTGSGFVYMTNKMDLKITNLSERDWFNTGIRAIQI